MNKLSLSYILHRIYNSQNLGVFYAEDMPLSELQAELGILCLERFAEVRSVRNGNSDIFAALCPLPTWPIMNSDIDPSWLKQKVFVTDLERLNLLSRALQKRGVRAGNFNWPSLLEGQGSQSCLNASQVAKFWIDIPIHQRINLEEIESIVSVLTSYA
jgi:dTDP-4-amino-4,6-dideoxygalactose transaminase